MVNNSQLPQARLQALHTLDGLGALTESVLLKGLRGPRRAGSRTRCGTVRTVGSPGKISDTAWSRVAALSADPSVRVRYQLALAVGEIERPEKAKVLADVLQRDITSQWVQGAVLSSVNRGASDLLISLASDSRWRNDSAGQAFLNELALTIGMKGQLDEVEQALNLVHNSRLDQQTVFTLLSATG